MPNNKEKNDVIVFGNDKNVYNMPGTNSSHSSGSWKAQLLQELSGKIDLDRLHFTGLIDYGTLSQLFRRSDLHCYFTRPYVVSWGVFQAAASGCRAPSVSRYASSASRNSASAPALFGLLLRPPTHRGMRYHTDTTRLQNRCRPTSTRCRRD